MDNSSTALWTNVTVDATGQTSTSGNIFVAKTNEVFGYDLDGNLTNDGRWTYTWDGENRLTKVESLTNSPSASKRRVTWEYDGKGRRVRQKTEDGSSGSYVVTEELKFLSDGWRHIAELNATNNALIRSYAWGLDLSGSLDGAGGVGGLLILNSAASGAHFHAYDGNGNVTALVKAADGTVSANYEYDPFGQTVRSTGLMANENPFRFSTKRTDNTTDFVLYEYRVYKPSTGSWLSRDAIGERGGDNLYSFVNNAPVRKFDPLGLVTFHEASIASGQISYSCNCGWLDWDHFRFGAGFVNEIDRAIGYYESDPTLDKLTIERTGPKSVLGARGQYHFVYTRTLDTRSRVLLNLDLMMRMSILYETAQNGFLFNVAGGFSVEDLPSNYIGALERLNELMPGSTGLDRKKVMELCHVLNTGDSLRMYKFGAGPLENRSHTPKLWTWRGWAVESNPAGPPRTVTDNCDPCAKASKRLPRFFTRYPVDKAGGFYRILDETTWNWWVF